MTALWDKLFILLNQTLALYQALLKLSQKKRDVLVAAKSQEIELLTKQEEVLIVEAGKLEALRLKLMTELAVAIGLSPDETTLSALITHADRDTAAKLNVFSEAFTRVTGELVELNELNAKLIQQSLEFINYSINILSQNAVGPTYVSKGGQATANAASRSILDTKV